MSEPLQPSGRFHRVTTRRRNLQILECPLEPELLVAEFAGELPPDVALAVREHIAVCDICGTRSQTLQTPYEVIASLGNEPVPYVPDLRDSVQSRLAHSRTTRRVYRAAGALSHGGGLAALIVVGAVVLVGLLLVGIISASSQNLSPSTNQLANVPAAAPQGTLLAETDKLVTVSAAKGVQWKVAEVIAVNERNGSVLHSLPTSTGPLHSSTANQLPVATGASPDGQSIYEVTAPNGHHQQALVAFNSSHGKVLFVTVLTLPSHTALPADDYADTLAVAPDGSEVYVGLGPANPASSSEVRVLVYSATSGALLRALAPEFMASNIPMPPPPGSLPSNVFPYQIPYAPDLSGYDITLGDGGKLVVSSDGQWLFDEELVSQNGAFQYVVVRRFSTQTGAEEQELAIAGDFRISQLDVTSPAAKQQQLYLIQGGEDCNVYVLDPGPTGPTQIGSIELGGEVAPPGTVFSGSVTLAPADGTQVFATENISADGGAISNQDLWLLDTQSMTEEAHLLDGAVAADSVLANPAGSYSGAPFILSSGEVFLAPYSLQGTVVPWLSLSDGHPVIALLASAP